MRRVKIKIHPSDTVYSKIIRFKVYQCPRCHRTRDLECAHIVTRARQATRCMLEPVPNAIPLCHNCHEWFDSHKSTDVLFDERLQKIKQPDNAFYFLVSEMGYTWDQLIMIYHKSQNRMQGSMIAPRDLTKELREILKSLEKLDLPYLEARKLILDGRDE